MVEAEVSEMSGLHIVILMTHLWTNTSSPPPTKEAILLITVDIIVNKYISSKLN